MYFYQLGTYFPQLEQQMKQGFENQVHMIIALNHLNRNFTANQFASRF